LQWSCSITISACTGSLSTSAEVCGVPFILALLIQCFLAGLQSNWQSRRQNRKHAANWSNPPWSIHASVCSAHQNIDVSLDRPFFNERQEKGKFI
jgi:hypothetical protein